MKNFPQIESLLELMEEIAHLRRAQDLLLDVFFLMDRGLPIDSYLRNRILDHFEINEDE